MKALAAVATTQSKGWNADSKLMPIEKYNQLKS